jgi:hypothetical protein
MTRSDTMRRVVHVVSLSGLLGLTLAVGLASPASADGTYLPSDAWNGVVIYLSRACHDGNDGVPGGPCITNNGCSGYSENSGSAQITAAAILGTGEGENLLERGYKVIMGTGTVSQNISASNASGARLHIPIHTNARSESCTNTTTSVHGTEILYRSTNGGSCADYMVARIGPGSPGSNDRKVYRTDLGELNTTTAIACYIEADYHTWNSGVQWINGSVNWSWRIGYSVDAYLGYP